jgi:hypothetical protein
LALLFGVSFSVLLLPSGCAMWPHVRRGPVVAEPPAVGPVVPSTPEPAPDDKDKDLVVRIVHEEVVVAAWAEPRSLPRGGGQAQIIVRLQKRGGAPFPGVEVRLRCSSGRLYSRGRVLTTDRRGMTRDRLTTTKTSVVTLNAGGKRYRFRVPVAEAE